VIWEQTHGRPIPKGKIVAFKDSNPLNCDIDNLMLISRHELLIMNKYKYKIQPQAIKPSLVAISKLHVKTSEKQKEV
jgi:hypothetical protein